MADMRLAAVAEAFRRLRDALFGAEQVDPGARLGRRKQPGDQIGPVQIGG